MSRSDPRDGLAYSQEVAARLWPGSRQTLARRPAPGTRSWLLLPSPARTRLVVPNDRRVAATALRAAATGRGGAARAGITAAAVGSRTGLAVSPVTTKLALKPTPRPPGTSEADEAVDAALSARIGQPVMIAWAVGPKRANRKPVLHVITTAGDTVAYAKAAYTPLNRRLMATESRALLALAGTSLDVVRVPRELARLQVGRGGETTDILALAPVNTHGEAVIGPPGEATGPLLVAMQEVARVQGSGMATLAESPWWGSVGSQLATRGDDPHAVVLLGLWQRLGHHRVALELGAWHGDWNPGNFAIQGRHVTVWDWERFATGVPIGFDAQHLAFQGSVTSNLLRPRAAAHWAVETAPRRLAAWGLDQTQARVTAAAHLVELGTRYLVDGQREAGAELGRVEEWLVPTLHEVLAGIDVQGGNP